MKALLQVTCNGRRIITGIERTGGRGDIGHANSLQIIRSMNRTGELHRLPSSCRTSSTRKTMHTSCLISGRTYLPVNLLCFVSVVCEAPAVGGMRQVC